MNLAILLAAGKSERAGRNKLWADVHGRPLWTLAYETLREHSKIDQIMIVVPSGEEEKFRTALSSEAQNPNLQNTQIIPGGDTRMQSFKLGLAAAFPNADYGEGDIIIDHNAANPNMTAEEIEQVLEAAQLRGAAAVSLPAVDTVLTVSEDGTKYAQNLDRNKIRLMQTPQATRGDILQQAKLTDQTDLTSALLATTPVQIVDANFSNQKITYAEDIRRLTCHSFIGEDSHRFSHAGTHVGTLTLGGIPIQGCPAMEANSDGDVILHAIGRALAAARDGSFSEVADKICQGGDLNSAAYLKPLLRGIRIQNISLQLEGKRPNIDKHAPAIKKSLAQILSIPSAHIRISAMSGEGLTSFGLGEGLRCICILNCQTRSKAERQPSAY